MDNSSNNMLFNLLVTKGFEPELLDISGKPITNPTEAEMFSFEYRGDEKNYGTVVILLGKEGDLQVFFGDNLGKTMELGDKDEWYDFLAQIKKFATRNLLNFKVNNINKLKYTMQGIAAINEGLFEGQYYGKKDVSYNGPKDGARLMIKHKNPIGENGKRYTQVDKLYVENSEGERFKLPFKNILGGKIMTRHVKNGGTPYDALGTHINDMMEEMNVLGKFINATRNKTYEDAGNAMVETAIQHYKKLKSKAKKMVSDRGYARAKHDFDPGKIHESEIATEVLKRYFVEQSIDQRIEEALPMLARLGIASAANNVGEEKMKEVNEFSEWVEDVTEGTWAVPETREEIKALEQLLAEPLILGPDATNATNAIYGYIGDDELFDTLYELSLDNPDADARPAIIARLENMGIDINIDDRPVTPNEDLDTDGVMMTTPSNMSSESLKRLAGML
jgi:hypothetical protein